MRWRRRLAAHRWGRLAPLVLVALPSVATALLLLSPTPGGAQTVTTYISNIDQGAGSDYDTSLPRAQSFTTGSQTGGYAVTSVDFVYEDDQGDRFSAAIYTANASGYPVSEVAALTAPSSFAKGTLTFTAPANTTLAASTTYAVRIVAAQNDVKLDATTSDAEDAGGASGWSIGDVAHFQFEGSWSATPTGNAIRIAVRGAPAAANNPATGAPTISGTAQVGETLTVATSGIMDADGLTTPGYTYQWIRVNGTDADISGATSSTYTLVAADHGKTIKVKVSFTDDAGNSETLTSAAATAVTAAITRSVAENAAAGVDIGAPVVATAGSGAVTYTLSGTDAASFDIVASTGQLQTKAALDHETKSSYEVTVTATDAGGAMDTTVTIEVTNVIELTAITGPEKVSFAENGGGRVATYTASSDEDKHGVNWILSGGDYQHFDLDSDTGALRFDIDPVDPKIFADPPDFEDPVDTGADNVYSVDLRADVGSATSYSLSVEVTVTDVEEPGAITLSSLKPGLATELTATLTDPDGVTDGATSWQWERNDGREGWTAITGATTASYTPTAADGDRYLRATATYTDSFGAGKTAEAIAPHVVIAHRLRALTAPGLLGVSGDSRAIYPDFHPDTLHYAARCMESVTLTLTTEEDATRLSVNGVQRPKGEAFGIDGLGGESDIRIVLTGAMGASTTYTVHCMDRERFPKLTTEKTPGAMEDLMMFKIRGPAGAAWQSALVMMDNNGVSRWRKLIDDRVFAYFRVYPDDTHPRARYAFTKKGSSYDTDGVEMVVLDKYFNTVDDDIHILSPFNNTDGHDQLILPNGDYVLMAYSRRQRDLSFVQTAFPDITDRSGRTLGTSEDVRDSVIQMRKADGTVLLDWNAWDHMAIEDCLESSFDDDWGHINAIGFFDGDIIAGFRRCSKILRIDLDTGDVVWRAGPSLLDRQHWEDGGTLQSIRGPAPLDFVNDPRGGFSGQHGGHMTVAGNLLVYDNATHCDLPPGVPDGAKGLKECESTRAVEYAFDIPNGELIFQSAFHMPATDPPRSYGGFAGHAEPMDNGDWLISWSNTERSNPSAPTPNTAMQVDPETGTEKLRLTVQSLTGSDWPKNTRVVTVSPVALAPQVKPLKAELPASDHTSVFHSGTGDSPQVVVEFNRPVVDFDTTSPSLSVTGATVTSVDAHVVAGEPANAYLVTLTPDGAGAISFRLVSGQACGDGGICTADGATLSEAPAALVIGPPVTVSFEQATHSVIEGASQSVAVRLSSAHQGVRGVTIPVVPATTGNASADDLTLDESVTFEAGETRKSLAVNALGDDLVEGAETATLEFGTLPAGVSAGSTSAATITLRDADHAQMAFTTGATQVSEGGQTQLSFAITNGVTFEVDQAIDLTLSGTATEGDDFTLVDAGNQVLSAPYTIRFPAGASSVEATIRAVDDADIEHADETIEVSASHGNSVIGTVTITITEAPPPPPPPPPPDPGGGGDSGGDDSGGGDVAPVNASELFEDVEAGVWYEQAVSWMILHRVTAGCATALFCPEANLSRRQFVTFLWRVAGRPAAPYLGSEAFGDVTVGGYAEQSIGWAVANGVTAGCTPGEFGDPGWMFCPTSDVTRGQMATLLYRHVEAGYQGGAPPYSDVEPDRYYAPGISWLTDFEVVPGCGPGLFCPDRAATRAEAAVFINGVAIRPHIWGQGNTSFIPQPQ